MVFLQRKWKTIKIKVFFSSIIHINLIVLMIILIYFFKFHIAQDKSDIYDNIILPNKIAPVLRLKDTQD